MVGVRTMLVLLALAASGFGTRALHAAEIRACCVCSGCPTAATLCVLAPVGDTAPDTFGGSGNGGAAQFPSACDIGCEGCASSQFVAQSCADVLQCQQPVHAPATSPSVLVAIGAILAAYGVFAARRARRHWRT